MFTDLALSRDTMKSFLSEKDSEDPSQKLSVMVLQRSVWPFSARKKDVDLPPTVRLSHVHFCALVITCLQF